MGVVRIGDGARGWARIERLALQLLSGCVSWSQVRRNASGVVTGAVRGAAARGKVGTVVQAALLPSQTSRLATGSSCVNSASRTAAAMAAKFTEQSAAMLATISCGAGPAITGIATATRVVVEASGRAGE